MIMCKNRIFICSATFANDSFEKSVAISIVKKLKIKKNVAYTLMINVCTFQEDRLNGLAHRFKKEGGEITLA